MMPAGTFVESERPHPSNMHNNPIHRLRPLWFLSFVVIIVTSTAWNSAQEKKSRNAVTFHDGDIVFQSNMAGQGAAIAQATRSPYTHCGIVFIEDGAPVVWEAVGPVKRTPWKEFVRHGSGGHYVVKRMTAALNAQLIDAMKRKGEAMMGLPYDIHFQMDDTTVYCSELVYKMYATIGIEAGTLEDFCSMHLDAPIAHAVLVDRFGGDVPCGSQVITPASLFRWPLLHTVDSIGAPPAIP